jgi:SnoaL-like protein
MTSVLEDRQAIADVFRAYCDALDRKNWPALDEIFDANVRADWMQGKWKQNSRADMVAFIRSFVDSVDAHHLIGNHFAVITGNTAKASCKIQAHHAGKGEKAHLFEQSLGEYSGTLVRAADAKLGWKFIEYKEDIMIVLGTFDVFARPTG